MQNFAAELIWIALLALPDLASAKTDGPPSFDVARSCKDAQAYANDKNLAYQGCMKEENDARAEVASKWAHFKPGDRKDCAAQLVPVPSYVELLTCLEMSDEAEALYNPDGTLRDKPQGGAVQGKSGQGQAAPSSAAPPPESGAVQGKSGQGQAAPSSAAPPPAPESAGVKKPD